jgi:hypothetical protein
LILARLRRLLGPSKSRPSRGSGPRRPCSFRPRLEILEDRQLLSILTVTNNSLSGAGSLNAILAQAANGDTIRFSPSLANQTIPGSYTLTNNLTIDNATAPASGLTLGGGSSFGEILTINSGNTVTISGLTITNSPGVREGGILNFGTLSLLNILIQGNNALDGSGGGIDAGLGESFLPTEKENYPPKGWKPRAPLPASRPLQPPLTVPQLETLPAPARSGLGNGQARREGSQELAAEAPPNPAGVSQKLGFWQRLRCHNTPKSAVWMEHLAAVLAGFGCWIQEGRRDKNGARSPRGDS